MNRLCIPLFLHPDNLLMGHLYTPRAAVVRLYTATGNYRVTALALRFGDAKFELTQLIPRHFETGHLGVLNPHIDAAECCRQAL